MAKNSETSLTVTDQLKRFITATRLNLHQVSQSSGVAPSQLYRFMAGERTLAGDAIDKLCASLGLRLVPERRARKAAPEAGQ
jgi:hypothetical protein